MATNTLSVDFSTYDASNSSVKKFLYDNQLNVATYTINKTADPYGRAFTLNNTDIQDGYLTMTVSGGTPPGGNVPSSGIRTAFNNILYGTFKTVAITSPVPGVCHGFFTYKNDSQETDIEILTAFYTTGNDHVRPGLQLTNQNTSNDHSRNTHLAVPYPADPTEAEHEYKIVWSQNETQQFFDGALIGTLETNVPSVPSYFVWNSWSSGNDKWSAGPPTEDAILRIKSIELEYETA
ncbi:glycoside hydrolase family 16 protein [Polyporus arcularius HHB13444]|uniref:Glycoside hydrolase family 16 protein n=1 Tax=Polyporus arcularius HHB13444 TaxID=1314778 RepID=A0A5C3P6L4_9APHY|nr:glycoside hydrolase family 16 protein [Polyporus arcularius HHB13444]